jgi:hypothetical protein
VNPTCQHDGCHDTRTASYSWAPTTGATSIPSDLNWRTVNMAFVNIAGWSRLCRIHARHTYGASLG